MSFSLQYRLLPLLLLFSLQWLAAQPRPEHNLVTERVPRRWDEGLPMGNGLLGCLLWQREDNIRLSLDRADLWDLRPMAGLDRPEFRYAWVSEKVRQNDYGTVQQYFDAPYEQEPGPTKLPGAALEFPIYFNADLHCTLNLSDGLTTLSRYNEPVFESFVHANRREGWFRFKSEENMEPKLVPPPYSGNSQTAPGGSVEGDDLVRLGYRKGAVFSTRPHMTVYRQICYGGFSYEVAIAWQGDGEWIEGVWSISSHFAQKPNIPTAQEVVQHALPRGFSRTLEESRKWWAGFWAKSSLHLPDSLIQRQYYRDMYKFGCVARADAPMISLQAIWTVDNGRLPPWKGDLHHDLNTQMSYWPAYTANHLDEASAYWRHLESNELAHYDYTRRYFGTTGLNVPGVETLTGEPMGGWIQYACSPTTSAWLSQHFYWQWRYSADRRFLRYHAWPWFKGTATHLEQLMVVDQYGNRVLPLSSSPEIRDNSMQAWWTNNMTNYDLTLCLFVFQKTAELAEEMNLPKEAEHWRRVAAELPPLAVEADGALMIAPDLPFRHSHRHFSHLMAIYPLGLIEGWVGDPEQRIINASLARLDSAGTGEWTGYSFAWLASLRARNRDGDGARKALRIFAEAFVSFNSFHLNGDQTAKGYSNMHYRPFTLEGNFAFAAGVQEMLLQSSPGRIEVFPAVPDDWRDVSFEHLRADGAILVSAVRKDGRLSELHLEAEKNTGWVYVKGNFSGSIDEMQRFTLSNAQLGSYDVKTHQWPVRLKAGGRVSYKL